MLIIINLLLLLLLILIYLFILKKVKRPRELLHFIDCKCPDICYRVFRRQP